MTLPNLRIGQYVTFKPEREHREYPTCCGSPLGGRCPMDQVWIITGFEDTASEYFGFKKMGMAKLRMADNPAVTLHCFTGRLEDGFLAQVKAAIKEGKKHGLRQSTTAAKV